jgi:hypothetical protein
MKLQIVFCHALHQSPQHSFDCYYYKCLNVKYHHVTVMNLKLGLL